MANFPKDDAELSGAPQQSRKSSSKAKVATRVHTLTSERTSETRATQQSSATSSTLGSLHCGDLGHYAAHDHCAEEALASEPEEVDRILEDSHSSGSCCSAEEAEILSHRRTIHESDCAAAPSICKLDHLAALQDFLANEGWDPVLLADMGDFKDYDALLVEEMYKMISANSAHIVLRMHPAMSGLQAGEQYEEVTLEEWTKSGGAGSGEGSEAEVLSPAEPSLAAQREPLGSPAQHRRIHFCPAAGGGKPAQQPQSLSELEPLAGSPALALRGLQEFAFQDFEEESASGSQDPGR